MKNKPSYVHVYRDRHGKVRSYYRRGKIKQRIDGEPGSGEWHTNYGRIHKSFEHPGRKAIGADSLKAAIGIYLESPRYRKLANSSQRAYMVAIKSLEEDLGVYPITAFTRGQIVTLRDNIARHSPSMAELTVKVLNLVFEAACDCDLIDRNPAKNVRPPANRKTEPHRPWTKGEMAMFMQHAKPFARRAVMVLLYTGLRASDAVLLKRSSIESGAIRTRTKKTNTPVVIPIHAALQAELAKPLPVESLYLVPGRRGQQMSVPAISSAIKRQFEMLGHDDRPPMHGLRKNAVTALIEAGCKPRQIQAITGQSLQMIEHYGQDYDRENLAAEAIHIWERQEKWQP